MFLLERLEKLLQLNKRRIKHDQVSLDFLDVITTLANPEVT